MTISMEPIEGAIHSVHLTNAGQPQAAADLQTKPTDLGSESACRLHHRHCYYSALKLIGAYSFYRLGTYVYMCMCVF